MSLRGIVRWRLSAGVCRVGMLSRDRAGTMPKELTTEVVRGCLLYLDVNWKFRWAYSSRNYVNNFTCGSSTNPLCKNKTLKCKQTFTVRYMCPWSTKAVISSTVIFVAIAKNTLYGSKL